MTRINIIPTVVLTNRHLVAEYTELPRIAPYLIKTLKNKKPEEIKSAIAKQYILGKGHVYFWYDKIPFLLDRFAHLKSEMTARGIKSEIISYEKNCNRFYNLLKHKELLKDFFVSYQPTLSEQMVNAERIANRISEKPQSYPDQNRFFIWYQKLDKINKCYIAE